jgi:mRNA-degrading endonuclease toxin of MazEF toxin-antitoxin module
VSSPSRGRIVWLAIPDSDGGGGYKEHPAVIVIPPDADGMIRVVGISTNTTLERADRQVELPWDRQGRAKTGLTERSVAVCTWLHRDHVDAIRRFGGTVPGRQMTQINLILQRLASETEPA